MGYHTCLRNHTCSCLRMAINYMWSAASKPITGRNKIAIGEQDMQQQPDLHEEIQQLKWRVGRLEDERANFRDVLREELRPMKETQEQHTQLLRSIDKRLAVLEQGMRGVNEILAKEGFIPDNPDI